MDFISSPQNPLIKLISKLDKKREREKIGQFMVEGIREVELAVKGGWEIGGLCFNQKWAEKNQQEFIEKIKPAQSMVIEQSLFEKLTYRGGVPNVLAFCHSKQLKFDQLVSQPNALILILESLEKPGNIGAIFRTADAAGVDAIILSESVTDMFNPNVVRASLGTLFTVPFIQASNTQTLEWLKSRRSSIIASWLEASKSHFDADYTSDTAIIMGSEAFGISGFWIENAPIKVKIPMNGAVDSMNVSTATAVLTYEAVRQRLG